MLDAYEDDQSVLLEEQSAIEAKYAADMLEKQHALEAEYAADVRGEFESWQ